MPLPAASGTTMCTFRDGKSWASTGAAEAKSRQQANAPLGSQAGIIGDPPLSVPRALDVPQAPLTARRPPIDDRLGRRSPQRHAHGWAPKGGGTERNARA